ncbi:uncharacterized protein LOC123702519 isoform X2 [Colias croceus]|uniref:uncharacterized protein LOC123702519 isoform X2 n=1 Tax=Colias crocea TaxID=72248 RepID=UPI001E281A2D|nr:uncharacterized protein LOC123702519 isoform X2 [Colias croceus]
MCTGQLQITADVRNLISESIPRELCIPCGTSLLRALQTHAVSIDLVKKNIILKWIPTHQVDYLDQVCMPRWIKAHRAVQRCVVTWL